MTEKELPGYGVAVPWHDLKSIREALPDTIDVPDTALNDLLLTARQAVEAFAPALPNELIKENMCPVNYRLAHMMQTRNLWNSFEVDGSGAIGEDMGYSYRPYPLDWIVKQVLRPARSVPVAL
jgi:hypothetical protein